MKEITRTKIYVFLTRLGEAYENKKINNKELTKQLVNLLRFVNNLKGHKKI